MSLERVESSLQSYEGQAPTTEKLLRGVSLSPPRKPQSNPIDIHAQRKAHQCGTHPRLTRAVTLGRTPKNE